MTGRRAPTWLTFANRVNRPLLRRGFGPRPQHLLVVEGRKSGVVRATPIAVLEQAGARYLVAGFDGADWIKNVRHQGGRAVLQRGARREHVMLLELPVGERAPILRAFARKVRGGRAFVTVAPDAPDHDFVTASPLHPVFRIGDRRD
ncbi:MAG TPA: nitroreductase/quinone reductase family protein [Candidatus Limnocylindria bacterium]|jgi:hypothetical protein